MPYAVGELHVVDQVVSVRGGKGEVELIAESIEEPLPDALPYPHGAIALDVAVARDGTHRGRGTSDAPAQDEEVDHLPDRGNAVAVLRVRPIPQQTMILSAATARSRISSFSARSSPVPARTSSQRLQRTWSATPRSRGCRVRRTAIENGPGRSVLRLEQKSVDHPEEGEIPTRTNVQELAGDRRAASTMRRRLWGFLNRLRPASGGGLTATTEPPLRLVRSSAVSIRGWFVPGFCPTTSITSA